MGHIAPAILDTSGEEMRKLLPEGVLHVGLTISEPIQTLGAEQAASAFARMVDAGKRLAAEKVDVIDPAAGPDRDGRARAIVGWLGVNPVFAGA